MFEALTRSTSDKEAHIQEQTNDFEELRIRLLAIPGVSDNTAAIIMSEIGTNVHAQMPRGLDYVQVTTRLAERLIVQKQIEETKYIKSALSQSVITDRIRRDTDLANFYYR